MRGIPAIGRRLKSAGILVENEQQIETICEEAHIRERTRTLEKNPVSWTAGHTRPGRGKKTYLAPKGRIPREKKTICQS